MQSCVKAKNQPALTLSVDDEMTSADVDAQQQQQQLNLSKCVLA